MLITIVLFVLLIHVAIPLVCHRKECSEVLNCGIGWDTCEGTYCYMLRLQNLTNSQHFLLRRGCFGDDSPQIRYNAELKPFTSLNECRRTVWKDVEYLITICADNDYCNVCNFWAETKPEKSGVVGRRPWHLPPYKLHFCRMDCPRPCDVYPNGRVRPLVAQRMAILVVDVQNYVMEKHPLSESFHEQARKVVIPNIRRLIEAARQLKVEVVFTVMENQTRDGRDRSLDYKLSNFFIHRGSREAKVVDELTPLEDELVIPKTSCSLFNSTNFAYLIRNIGVDTIVVTGFLTDQCIDQTIRDGAAASGGFWMIGVRDACAADTAERHSAALKVLEGYCRMESTESLIEAMRKDIG